MATPILRTARRISALLPALILSIALFVPTAPAQEGLSEDLYDIRELERLIQIARESGFTEEEVKKITIEAEGQVINAWEFLEARRRAQKEAEEEARRLASKQYLTVKDVFDELDEKHEKDLQTLREKSVFID